MNNFSFDQKTTSNPIDKNFNPENQQGAKYLSMPGERHLKTHDGKVSYAIASCDKTRFSFDQHAIVILLNAIRDFHWKTSDGKSETFHAPAGTVLLLPHPYEAVISWSGRKEYISILFDENDPHQAKEGFSPQELDNLFSSCSHYSDNKCLQVAHLFRHEMQKNAPASDAYIDALRIVFMTLILQNHPLANNTLRQFKSGGLNYHSCQNIETYLASHFSRKISITELAKHLNISTGHFLTAFKESFGQTPHQFILTLRLNEAESLLHETHLTLAEIAMRTGFSSQSHMTTALRKYRNITPGEIRRRSGAANS